MIILNTTDMEIHVINQSKGKAESLSTCVKFISWTLMITMITAFEGSAQYRMAWNRVYGSGDLEQRSYVMILVWLKALV